MDRPVLIGKIDPRTAIDLIGGMATPPCGCQANPTDAPPMPIVLDRLRESRPEIYEAMLLSADILSRKAHDYAETDDPYSNFRMCEGQGIPAWQGVLVRIGDKFSRLQQLAQKPAEVTDESFEDTLLDLANYAYICLALRKQLPAGGEVCKSGAPDLDTPAPDSDVECQERKPFSSYTVDGVTFPAELARAAWAVDQVAAEDCTTWKKAAVACLETAPKGIILAPGTFAHTAFRELGAALAHYLRAKIEQGEPDSACPAAPAAKAPAEITVELEVETPAEEAAVQGAIEVAESEGITLYEALQGIIERSHTKIAQVQAEQDAIRAAVRRADADLHDASSRLLDEDTDEAAVFASAAESQLHRLKAQLAREEAEELEYHAALGVAHEIKQRLRRAMEAAGLEVK